MRSGLCRVSGNPHAARYFSPCAPRLEDIAQILTQRRDGRHSLPPDCDHSGRVLGSILFLSCFHSQAMPSATVSKAFRRFFSPIAVTLILFSLGCNAFAQTAAKSPAKSAPKKTSQILNHPLRRPQMSVPRGEPPGIASVPVGPAEGFGPAMSRSSPTDGNLAL